MIPPPSPSPLRGREGRGEVQGGEREED